MRFKLMCVCSEVIYCVLAKTNIGQQHIYIGFHKFSAVNVEAKKVREFTYFLVHFIQS